MVFPLTPDEELRRLKEFVEHLRALLQAVANQPGDMIPGRHHEAVQLAWGEVGSQFAALTAGINSNARPKLEGVGLVGYRLRFELGVFNDSRGRLVDHAPDVFGPLSADRPAAAPVQPKAHRWKRMLRRLLRKCLGSADVILGSLASLFPPAEAIKQFKEGIEQAVDLAGDR